MTTSPTEQEMAEQLAQCRIQLAHSQEQLEAVKYEFEAFKQLVYGIEVTGDYTTGVMRSWQNALGNRLILKSHWIDALAMTTRAVVERDKRSNPHLYL